MLSQLYIENIAVIRQATIDSSRRASMSSRARPVPVKPSSSVLSMPCWADGPSRRSSAPGRPRATVSALFTEISEGLCKKIEVLGYPLEDNQLLVQREIDLSGKGQCRLDGRPATAAMLREVCSLLIDIHGQHDDQELLSAEKHLGFLDRTMALTRRKWLLTPSLTKGCASVLPGWISFKWMKATSCSAWIFFSFKLRRSAMPS